LIDPGLETWNLKDQVESNEQSDHAEDRDYEKDWDDPRSLLSRRTNFRLLGCRHALRFGFILRRLGRVGVGLRYSCPARSVCKLSGFSGSHNCGSSVRIFPHKLFEIGNAQHQQLAISDRDDVSLPRPAGQQSHFSEECAATNLNAAIR
jgi:hypothetical protein